MAELIEDAAHHLASPSIAAEHLELRHHAIEREFHTGKGVVGVTIALALQAIVAALQFLSVELGEQGHATQGIHRRYEIHSLASAAAKSSTDLQASRSLSRDPIHPASAPAARTATTSVTIW